ncbi:hypothetical protein D3C87_1256570 [compost metagenome]
MRVLDWVRVLGEHKVPYIERGANVKRGEINVRCPFCGSADPSYHMGINLETGWYSCWRNRSQHSGKSPLRLLMKMLRVPYGVARQIAGLGDDYVDPEGFDAMAAAIMGRDGISGAPQQVKRRHLELDGDFAPIAPRGGTRRHFDYMVEERGFREGDMAYVGRRYGVCAGVRGDWAHRVILPYYQDDQLVTWTGRALGYSTMRYRDLSRDESVLPPKETLFNHDCLLDGGRVLLVVEGPMDGLKLDVYARRFGVRAVGLSTNSATDAQAFLLQAAADNFERVLTMMDNGDPLDIVDSMRMSQTLGFLPNVGSVAVPYGAKDGAALTPEQIEAWAEAL